MRTIKFTGVVVLLITDIPVHGMTENLQRSYPERCDDIFDMMGIYLNWRLYKLNVWQRRRVQILVGMIRPFKLLLLDDIMTSIDVCVRKDMLCWIIKESNDHVSIYSQEIFTSHPVWFYIGINDDGVPSSHLRLNLGDSLYRIERVKVILIVQDEGGGIGY